MAQSATPVSDMVKKLSDKYKAGDSETTGLGKELQARAQMNSAAEGALAPTTTPEAPRGAPAKMKPAQGPYGSQGKEKRINTEDYTKPLGSFAKGTDSVPKTGTYKLHEGEKVVPEKDNPDSKKGEPMAEHSPEEKAHFSRAMHKLHGGALHRHLGIPEGEPIPMEKKQEAANSSNKHVAAMGRMAVAMHGWKH